MDVECAVEKIVQQWTQEDADVWERGRPIIAETCKGHQRDEYTLALLYFGNTVFAGESIYEPNDYWAVSDERHRYFAQEDAEVGMQTWHWDDAAACMGGCRSVHGQMQKCAQEGAEVGTGRGSRGLGEAQ